jgi:hypothetical protein
MSRDSMFTMDEDGHLNRTRLLNPLTSPGTHKSTHSHIGSQQQQLLEDPEDSLRRPWKKFFLPNEEEVFSGSICKPEATTKKRLVLVKSVEAEPALPFQIKSAAAPPLSRPGKLPEQSAARRYLKRLLYIDEKNLLKGQIKWYPKEKPPKIRKVDDKCFEVVDYHVQKAYLFYPKDDCTVNQWIQVLENL